MKYLNFFLKVCLVCCVSVWSFSCQRVEKQEHLYEINGLLKDVPDNTTIYLKNEDFIDSARILEGKFKFSGEVNKPTRAALFFKGSGDQLIFWLENSLISVQGSGGNIEESYVVGGSIQKTRSEFLEQLRPIRTSMDSIALVISGTEITESERTLALSEYRGLVEKQRTIEKEFIRENPSSFEAALILNNNKSIWEKQLVRELYVQMDTTVKKSVYGTSTKRYLDLHREPGIGEKYVDFVQVNDKGENIKFSSKMGKVTLLEFWASWCVPCRRSNPDLLNVYKEYSDKGFQIVGVSIDEDRASWLKAIEQDSLSWPNLTDLKGVQNAPYIIYGIDGIPDNFLINEAGVIIGRNLKVNDLQERLASLLID